MKVFAHRGYSGKYPENTMLSFKEAAKAGCDGMELDVQLTKDGRLVVIHDEAVDRTTDGSGLVKDYTLEDLLKLDASAVKGGKFGFCQIPTFEEYCAWASDNHIFTNVEIKTGVYYYEDIEEKTLELVRKYHLEDQVLFSSFNHLSLERLKKLAPEIPCGALLEHAGLGNAGYYCKRYGYRYYHPGIKGLTAETVRNCTEHGIGVNVWTVNDMESLENTFEWGCTAVFSNYPGVCKAWLDRR